MQKQKALVLALVSVLLITTGAACSGGGNLTLGAPAPVTLEVWRVYDPSTNFSKIISGYQALHPNVRINYKNFTYDEFENKVVNALAEDRGPDIVSVHNTWLGKWQPKLEPMPAKITVPYIQVQGTLKKETFTELRTSATPSLRSISDSYLDVVSNDAVIDGKVYGLPLSMDTLGLYYNKDLFKNAGIIQPPKTWGEFQEATVKLTRQDQRGTIVQSGAAIGTALNNPRATDMLSLLMMQNGAQMLQDGQVTFNQNPRDLKRTVPPAVDALNFYTDFASPAKQVYTWNNQLPNAQEAFISGKTAMYFDYSFGYAQVRARAPKLNFDVAPVPQISGNSPVNYGSYWLESVTKKSKNKDIAWDFILFETSPQIVTSYLQASGKPTVLKALIPTQQEDIVLAPFVSQLITAQTWYRGKDPVALNQIFSDMIADNLAGITETVEILNRGAGRVAQTF